MNKLYFKLTTIAALFAVAAVAVSCSEDVSGNDEGTAPVYPQEPEPEFIEGARVSATAVAPLVTRGHLTEGVDNLPTFVWDAITSAAEGGYVMKTAIVSATDGTLLNWHKGDAFTTSNLSIEADVATLETELPVAVGDISSNGTIVPAGYPYIYVMQQEDQFVTSNNGNLRFKVKNPYLGAKAIASDGSLESLEKGMSVYATGNLSDAITSEALSIGEVNFELIPAIFKINVANVRSTAIDVKSIDVEVYKENGTVATALASELFLDATYDSNTKSFNVSFSDESSTEYSSQLSLSNIANSTIDPSEADSYYQMTLPSITTPTLSTYQAWSSLSFRVKYSVAGSEDIYLAKLRLESDNAFFDEGAIIPSKIYESTISITDADILASDEVEELGPNTIRSEAGKLGDLMIAKFGANYASTTLDKVEILGSVNQADFAALKNVKELVMSEAAIVDGDNSNIIPYEAFYNNAVLARVELPADVTNISVRAFANCPNLTEVVFPTKGEFVVNNLAFFTSGIVNLVLPSNCKQVNYRAFYGCASLISAELNTKVIGNETFTNCTSLTSVKLIEGLAKIDASTFEGCTKLSKVNIPNSVTIINAKAFQSTLISDVTLPEALKTLGAGAFFNCKNITSITIPATTTDISAGTPGIFYGCDNLTEIKVLWMKDAPAVGQYTFPTPYTNGTRSISIPDGIDPDEVYGGNGWELYGKKQTTPYVPAGYTYVEAGTLDAVMTIKYGADYKNTKITDLLKFSGSMNATDLAALQNVTQVDFTRISFPNSAFPLAFGNMDAAAANKVLEYVVLPKTLSTIANSAFENCTSLKECVMPTAGNFTIGNRAFWASGLESVVIPANCKQINYAAFTNSKSLKSVDIKGVTGAVIGDIAFQGCDLVTEFIVPWSATAALPTITAATLPASFKVGGANSITVPNDFEPTVVYGSKGWELYNKRQEIPFVDPAYVNTTAGGLNEAMIVKFGEDYAASTITEIVMVKGEVNADEFGCLANVESLDLTKAIVAEIPAEAFKGNAVLKRVILPETLTSVGASAFEGAALLDVKFLEKSQFTIGAAAFKGANFSSLVIPSVCVSLGSEAFADCAGLVHVEVYGVTDTTAGFGGSTFAGCSSLRDFIVDWRDSDSIPTISATDLPDSFVKDSGANKVTVPNTVNPILFADKGWENYNIYNEFDDSGIITTAAGALANAMSNYFGKNYADNTITTLVTIKGAMNAADFAAIQNIEMLDMSEVVVANNEIPVNAFGNGDNAALANKVLKSIVLPKGVTKIGQKSFENCSALTSVTLPSEGQFMVDNRAFKFSGLTSVVIPTNCFKLAYASFSSCSKLESIVFEGGMAQGMSNDNFLGCNAVTSIKAMWTAAPPKVGVTDLPASFKVGGANSVVIPAGTDASVYGANGWEKFNIKVAE